MTLQASTTSRRHASLCHYEEIELDDWRHPWQDLDDLTIGVNYWYSDRRKATIQYEIDFENDGGARVTTTVFISGQVQFTF